MPGIDFESLTPLEREQIGVIVGTGAGGIEFAERQYRQYYDRNDHDAAYRRVSPYSIVASFVGMISSEINMAFRLHGMSHVVSTGCTSSTDAMGYAWNSIRSGQIDTIVTGGVEACITFGLMTAFCRMGTVTTKWNHEPARASRPFNADRDGFVLGEGAWVLIFEELEHARQARGADLRGGRRVRLDLRRIPPGADSADGSRRRPRYANGGRRRGADYGRDRLP